MMQTGALAVKSGGGSSVSELLSRGPISRNSLWSLSPKRLQPLSPSWMGAPSTNAVCKPRSARVGAAFSLVLRPMGLPKSYLLAAPHCYAWPECLARRSARCFERAKRQLYFGPLSPAGPSSTRFSQLLPFMPTFSNASNASTRNTTRFLLPSERAPPYSCAPDLTRRIPRDESLAGNPRY
jgi:hypothetical protein